MINIVQLPFNPNRAVQSDNAPQSPANVPAETSPLLFKAYERPLWYEGKSGTRYDNTGHKALIRMKDDKPVCLNVVQNSYKVVQNDELFSMISENMVPAIGALEWNNKQIIDKVSYNGALCMREYRFPGIKVESPERDTICFRVIVVNGFGTSAIKIIAGAIDFFCTNGMIRGEYVSQYAKHTSGLKIEKFADYVRGAVTVFWKDRDFWSQLRGAAIRDDNKVSKWLIEQFGERNGARLMHQYMIERGSRGGSNLWALYSALTHYSSHSDGAFQLRKTVNDHEAATMLKREQDVRRAVESEAFKELAA